MYLRTSIVIGIIIILIGIYYEKYIITKEDNQRRAWLTLLGTEEYLPGVLALARSLKRAKSIYPLIVMINENDYSEESKELILNEGCSIRIIEDLYPTIDSKTEFAFTRFSHTWKKLRAFEMIDTCDKCVFMDADIIVLRNMDEIFDLDDNITFGAVQTCTCNLRKISTFPEQWKKENCPYTYEQDSNNNQTYDHSQLHIVFNSGVFLFHPNLTIFQEMLNALNTWDLTQFKFGDQDFLNKFYHETWTRLPFIYNAVKVFSKSHPYLWNLSEIKTIHYVHEKPWQKSNENDIDYNKMNQLWWEAYEWTPETKN